MSSFAGFFPLQSALNSIPFQLLRLPLSRRMCQSYWVVFFFLMWTIFKVFCEFVTILLLLFLSF